LFRRAREILNEIESSVFYRGHHRTERADLVRGFELCFAFRMIKVSASAFATAAHLGRIASGSMKVSGARCMKTFIPSSPCFLGLLVLAVFSVSADAPPQLDPPRRAANGAVDLDLRGIAGATYAVDASTNLSSWFLLFSGIATNGVFSIRHDSASNFAAMFYRGRSAAERLPAVTVGPRADTNTSVISVMSLAGGATTLFGADGTRYMLTVPTNSMPEPTVFTMSEVTNIVGMPFAGPMIGAVRIEPGNLALWGTASLEITFPPTVDRRKIASFTARSDGSAFQLTLDRVKTNRVVIQVSRGGIYGSSIVTEAELADAARRDIGPATAPSVAPKKPSGGGEALTTNATDCQAAKKASAQALAQQIGAALAARSQASAVKLAAERQKQLSGATDDSSTVLAELADDICNFYNSDVAPHWPEATSNCAAGKVVTQFALSLARQLQLLGAHEDCIDFSSIPFCAMFANCLNEIEECCNAGNRGSAKVAEVLGLQRQDQLLGLDCISDARAQEVIDACSSNIWTGSFSITVSGHTNSTQTSTSGTRIQIGNFQSTFDGSVIESTEHGSLDVGFILELRVVGQISVIDFQSDSTETFGCNGIYDLQSDEVVAAGNAEYVVSISTDPDGTYNLFEFNRTSTTFGVPAKETKVTLRIRRSCDPNTADTSENKTTRSDTVTLGRAMPVYQGTWTDQTVLSASQTAQDDGNDPALQQAAKWNFTRRKAP
jgi:hypothetical protein